MNRNAGLVAFALLAVKGPPEPASVRAARRGVALPPAFDAWFARVTAPDPAARFCSASAAVDALATALGMAPLSSSGPRIAAAAPLGVAPADSGVGSGVNVSGTRAATTQPRRLAALAAAIGAVGALLGAGWIYVAASSTPAASGPASASPQQTTAETTTAPLRALPPEITPVSTEAPAPAETGASAPPAISSSAAASALPAASTSGTRAATTSTAAAPPTRPPSPPSPPSTPRSTRPQPSLPTPVYSPD